MENSFSISRRIFSVVSWILAILLSLLLNLGLFSLMPSLLKSGGPGLETPLPGKPLNVIRVKTRKEPPKKKEEIKKKVRKIQEKIRTVKRSARTKTAKVPLVVPRPSDLPFDPAPALPMNTVNLPRFSLETAAIAVPALKGSYEVGEIDNPLTPLAQGPPVYPFSARRRGVTGAVKVKFLVREDGRVENVSIIEALPVKIFDASVVKCVSAWRFSPGTVGGEPVKTWATTTIKFELE